MANNCDSDLSQAVCTLHMLAKPGEAPLPGGRSGESGAAGLLVSVSASTFALAFAAAFDRKSVAVDAAFAAATRDYVSTYAVAFLTAPAERCTSVGVTLGLRRPLLECTGDGVTAN